MNEIAAAISEAVLEGHNERQPLEAFSNYTDSVFVEYLRQTIERAVLEEREACALIARSNNAYETESDIINVRQSAYDTRHGSEKAAPEKTEAADLPR